MAAEFGPSPREEELTFRALAETIPQLVWTARPNGALVYANGRFLSYFGITRDDLPTWWLAANVHPEDSAEATRAWKDALASGDPYEIEYRLRGGDGTYHWFLARGHAYRASGDEITGWFGTCTPIDRQQARLERQAAIVDSFRRAFAPRPIPEVPGLVFGASYIPADAEARVGGDWFDVIRLDDGRALISMGDVTGHGVDAALATAAIRQAIIGSASDDPDPATVLRSADRRLALAQRVIATAVVAVVDPHARTLRYALAGHPPPIFANAHAARIEPTGGVPLGVGLIDTFATVERPLKPGTIALFYTDGLTEARRTIGEDEARLCAAAQQIAAGTLAAGDLRREVLGDTETLDDIAILTVALAAGPPRAAASTRVAPDVRRADRR